MPTPYNYNKLKHERASARGRMMAKARWGRRDAVLLVNPPPLSDANRVDQFLCDRKGAIAEVHDIADPRAKVVTTWVLRFSVKGRCGQFDLYRNSVMIPKYYPILRYD